MVLRTVRPNKRLPRLTSTRSPSATNDEHKEPPGKLEATRRRALPRPDGIDRRCRSGVDLPLVAQLRPESHLGEALQTSPVAFGEVPLYEAAFTRIEHRMCAIRTSG
jgi:hypothetical protein